MLMHQLLLDGAQRTPGRLALHWVDRDVALTYEQAVASMEAMAGALASLGVSPGDRVAVELSPYDLTRGRIVYRYK